MNATREKEEGCRSEISAYQALSTWLISNKMVLYALMSLPTLITSAKSIQDIPG